MQKKKILNTCVEGYGAVAGVTNGGGRKGKISMYICTGYWAGRSTMLNRFIIFSDLGVLGYGATAGATNGQGGKPQGKMSNMGIFQLSKNT